MSKEIELKLSLPKAALTALRRHPLIQGAEKLGNAVTLINTYYDTASLTLRDRKVALRTRKQGRKWLQTVKCAAVSTAGLSSRPEWEKDFLGAFDFTDVTDGPTAALLDEVADSLVAVFTTNFRRETYRLTPDADTEVLLMADNGKVEANGRVADICEIELELVRGRPDALFALACELAASIPLMPSDRSKAERGYRLFNEVPESPTRAAKSTISADQSPIDAFKTLAGECLAQWQANALAAMTEEGPEYIHQMRVALRRLRSLVKLFAPALPADFVAEWSELLRVTASDMGDARDFDVFLEEVLDPVTPEPMISAALTDGLRERVVAERTRARAEALDRLAHSDQGLRILRFARALFSLNTNALDASADLTAFAQLQMDALRKRARKRFALAQGPEPEHIHELRVGLKQLRYGSEFFLPLFEPTGMKTFMAAMRRAQEQLGYLNDVEIARGRMLGWLEDTPELGAAAHFVIGWHTPKCLKIRRRILLEVEPLLWGKAAWKPARKKTKSKD